VASLRRELSSIDRRHINTDSDSEVLLNVLARELDRLAHSATLTPDELFAAVSAVHERVRGSYAVVALIAGHGLLAFRDPFGIRPLSIGEIETPQGKQVVVASENVAIEGTGHKVLRDIAAGEAVFIDFEGKIYQRQCAKNPQTYPCIFEYVYLARPDSTLDGISVYQARLNLGEALAEELRRNVAIEPIDVVIPIPESSRPSAMQLAHAIDKPYREGFVKNRYVGRTFIMPGQAMRKRSVRQKLNAMASEFACRNVLLVDDSIVRGTTSKEIVQMARDAGAKSVYLASAAPPVRYPNVYGIDMPTSAELIADKRSLEQIRAFIGADALIYQDVDAMKRAIGKLNPQLDGFEASCFDGIYVTGDIDPNEFAAISSDRHVDDDEPLGMSLALHSDDQQS
jgi:amidophosphoribosyltransferase